MKYSKLIRGTLLTDLECEVLGEALRVNANNVNGITKLDYTNIGNHSDVYSAANRLSKLGLVGQVIAYMSGDIAIKATNLGTEVFNTLEVYTNQEDRMINMGTIGSIGSNSGNVVIGNSNSTNIGSSISLIDRLANEAGTQHKEEIAEIKAAINKGDNDGAVKKLFNILPHTVPLAAATIKELISDLWKHE